MDGFHNAFHKLAHLLCVAVYNYRVHVNDGFNTEFVAYFALHVVDQFVRLHEVAVGGYLGVETYYRAPRAVVVVNKVVYAEYIFMLQRKLIYRVGQLLAHGPAEQRRLRGFNRAPARLEYKYRNYNARNAVYRPVGVLPRDQRNKYHARRYHVGERVCRRRRNGGGVYSLCDLSVEVEHPELYKYGGDKHAHCLIRKSRGFGRYYLLYRRPRKLKSHEYNENRNYQPRHILYPAVAEGMLLVGLLPRKFKACKRYNGGGCV